MQSWRSTPKSWWKDWQNLQKFWVISKDQNISSSIKIKILKEKINGTIVFKGICFEETLCDLMWGSVSIKAHSATEPPYHRDDSQHFCKKIEIMFQTEDAKWRHAKNIFWEYSNRFDLFSNQIHGILSCEEENCFWKWTPISEARSYVWTMGIFDI